MTTPRSIRLSRVPDLAAFRTTLSQWILGTSPDATNDMCVVVPTRAAAEQLKRTVEETSTLRAIAWPVFATRRELYEELAARLPTPPILLTPFEREVILASVARALIEEGRTLPYALRPALVAEMLSLYDHLRRLGRRIEDFERNFRYELEREQDTDRGAATLLQQTEFLAAAYRAYEARAASSGRLDEHGLRDLVVQHAPSVPLRRVIVTIGDRLADPDGLWPADFDMLTRLPQLMALDVVCTEAMLAAGFIERLHAAFPDLEETKLGSVPRPRPVLVTPKTSGATSASAAAVFAHRDREEELGAVARRIRQQRRDGVITPLPRIGLIVRRPLPYLYLARDVFGDAGIPFETLDTLPLAAEPYAAALDVVLDAVASDFTRASLLALLRSPHFDLGEASRNPSVTVACDHALAEARFFGGSARLHALVDRWAATLAPASREERRRQSALPALRPLAEAVAELQPLADARPITTQIDTLLNWLRRFDRRPGGEESTGSRRQRVRGAVIGALIALREAYERHDPHATGDIHLMSATVRRWLGSQTFATQSGEHGVQVIDAQAARYAELDDIQLVGLIDGEWPDRIRRNVLYPSSLLALLEPLPAVADPIRRERDALQAARAAFHDLLLLARERVRLSTFALENDAVVEPSVLLDDIDAFGLMRQQVDDIALRVSRFEALAVEPRRADVRSGPSAEWAALRLTRDERDAASLRGHAGAWQLPRVSISRLELYLNCPFRFFAAHVLKLEEQPGDDAIQTPLERGRFLHELWERFFDEWQKRGHGRIDPEHLREARALFAEISATALATLSPAEAVLERQKLLGSAVDPGIAYRVFAMEASRTTPIEERLLEFPLEGDFDLQTPEGGVRRVLLNAKTDRIDVLSDGTLRVIDYKSKNTPDQRIALQLPVYAHLARETLRRTRGGTWTLAEALYLSFEGDKAIVPLRPARGQTLEDVLADAQQRAVRTLDSIAEGVFPPRPAKKSLCGPCAYRAVCRLEIVETAGEATDE